MDNTKLHTKNSIQESLDNDLKEYVHFLKLDAKKQERILSTAYNEFLEKGYAQASTNTIIQRAGISKGLLFYYFGSKAGLYKFLMKESTRRIASETLPDLPDENADVFALIKSIVRTKITVCLRYPKETNFIISAWNTKLPENLVLELNKMVDMSGNYVDILIGLLDDNLLREQVDKGIATEIISWVCEKYTDKMLSGDLLTTKIKDWDGIAEDLDKYLDALRYGLYK